MKKCENVKKECEKKEKKTYKLYIFIYFCFMANKRISQLTDSPIRKKLK
jgi:hypothetical protein